MRAQNAAANKPKMAQGYQGGSKRIGKFLTEDTDADFRKI